MTLCARREGLYLVGLEGCDQGRAGLCEYTVTIP